ncbi:M20 family metallopeptidase [Saccharibacillus sp. JS10]|uniref:M20 family metallopeptidase n=1 Tax=Saccharibacillus sp. JS10 TaxID=2950552 RepID=UPI00210A0EF8|nr:M20 family metallopeptidase [Saccharibacillus sp. JS10]MCQ4085320.1 M20 family metallopeptidase [Saccharibacillus sp. JS10]
MRLTEQVSKLIEQKKKLFTDASDRVWEFAEIRYEEFQSSQLLSDILEKEGFTVERTAGEIQTAFVASFGSGKPVIALLGEYDALAGLSQQAGSSEFNPVAPGGQGHGCGHNLLGTGALAAAVAAKDYMVTNRLPGTIRFYGCPAEESGAGKTFMARKGLFDDVDTAITWHPGTDNGIMQVTSLATTTVKFKFLGKSTHAAAQPHLGRSALDAVELMSVGVNYMREHMIDQARIHYAVLNTGGSAPNVVQSEAEVLYSIRAPKSAQVRELFDRVQDVARGAALMSGTRMEFTVTGATSDLIPNPTLERVMHRHMEELSPPIPTAADIAFAKKIFASIPEPDKLSAAQRISREKVAKLHDNPLLPELMPLIDGSVPMSASTDVGDVSWLVPTVQCSTATWAFATPGHSWQVVAQGQSPHAHAAMLYAGKSMAATALEVLMNPEIIASAKEDLKTQLAGESYVCPIPEDVHPPQPINPLHSQAEVALTR